MTDYYHLDLLHQMFLSGFVLISGILLLLYLVSDAGNQKGLLRRVPAYGLFAMLFLTLCEMSRHGIYMQKGRVFVPGLTIPSGLIWCLSLVADIFAVCGLVLLIHRRTETPTRSSIREAIDQLPDAVCFFTGEGEIRLCNRRMYQLFYGLTGRDLQSFEELKRALAERNPEKIRLGNSIFQYEEYQVILPQGMYTEAVFSDITELYNRRKELEQQTVELKRLEENLQELSSNVQIATREKEILSAKTRLHDQMGAALTAVRRILMGTASGEDTEETLRLLKAAADSILSVHGDSAAVDEWGDFLRDARAVGVCVTFTGTLPEYRLWREILFLAAHEALTNAVRHGDASELYIREEEKNGELELLFSDNGKGPSGEIVPKGGLRNVQNHVMNAGGRMEILTEPAYCLRIILPEPDQKGLI